MYLWIIGQLHKHLWLYATTDLLTSSTLNYEWIQRIHHWKNRLLLYESSLSDWMTSQGFVLYCWHKEWHNELTSVSGNHDGRKLATSFINQVTVCLHKYGLCTLSLVYPVILKCGMCTKEESLKKLLPLYIWMIGRLCEYLGFVRYRWPILRCISMSRNHHSEEQQPASSNKSLRGKHELPEPSSKNTQSNPFHIP